MRTIDLRSDTVTRPSPAMRRAMAAAEVADDVLERDPTLRELERRCGDLLGMPDALWVPTGCMSNTIALMLHLERGDSFLASAAAHVVMAELGTASWLGCGLPYVVPNGDRADGGPSPEDVARWRDACGHGYDHLRPRLVCVENTHNYAGGRVMDVAAWRAVVDAARDADALVHLDGARIWNAAVAVGRPPSELVAGADSVSVCLSKGLGAPMGSVLLGDEAFVARARRLRKMLGGGVRQGGVVGAAGLVALDGWAEQLAADQEAALALGEVLGSLGFRVRRPASNMVLVDTDDADRDVRAWSGVGVLAVPLDSRTVRLVTHRDMDRADVAEVGERLRALRVTA